MNISGLIAKKIDQSQGFLENGKRIPLTIVHVSPNVVSQIKTTEKEGYTAVQMATGLRKKSTKALSGHSKKAGIDTTPRFFREIRLTDAPDVTVGTSVTAAEIFEPGEFVDVIGTSKGKGFAGVVKRHHFRGGPRTHGQSDRERAPGSIGQTTTPGRVYKGKRMAGRMGSERVTLKNLVVMDVVGDTLYLSGVVPGVKGGLLSLIKKGKNKKFVPLYKVQVEEVKIEEVEGKPLTEEQVEVVEPQVQTPTEEAANSEVKEAQVETASETVKTPEEVKEPEVSVDEEKEKKDAK